MQITGSAIDRVFNPAVAPTSKFAGLIDTALALGLGSICAFALTLGPAPLNTVAASSAAAASLSAHLDPSPVAPLLDVDRETPGAEAQEETPGSDLTPPSASLGTSPDASASAAPGDSVVPQKSTAAPAPRQPGTETKVEAPPPASKPVAPVQTGTGTDPLGVVEAYRLASGLPAFVSAEACGQSRVHASVVVTPNEQLPPGQAKKSLAPHPAYATADSNGPGAISVTIHACQ
jgi:hypothetical protein